ncbi:hypothetical protein L249_8911 [Ophiocordyceps polyrhachis-furcata BCC 54312]|uniref:ribonuclease H n=1 Tax=Ophiocordyceps polyrhachis-furcata BCC 54312 TaxID=1330021 RepID=A0A367L2G5_9HYPO|nr:hypothetical protein L249_8911 [Ophiocordyceps polyrhachis-furcata BCC 54312]
MDDIGPVELPDGRLVCRRHGLAICGLCCVDFSFMDEQYDEEEEAEREADELYHQLSDDARAEIDARWGSPPRKVFSFMDEQYDEEEEAEREADELYEELSDDARAKIDARWGFPSRIMTSFPSLIGRVNVFGPNALSPDTRAIRRGSGQVFPTLFTPPSAKSTPGQLFPASTSTEATPAVVRFIRRGNPKQALIYADGACLNNGQANPKAGWAFYFQPGTGGIVSGRLERQGPFGDESPQTSNRAELRAVIAALRFRYWPGEGFRTLVLATDSEYVAMGATTRVRRWIRNGWRTSAGLGVKNRDLWEALLGEAERWHERGLKIQFWKIPRHQNTTADRAAKEAAAGKEDRDAWGDISGVLV